MLLHKINLSIIYSRLYLLQAIFMQLFALDFDKQLVNTSNAKKQQDYFCLECGQAVRIRRGLHRHTHFYHLSPIRICRQHGKGMVHLQTQAFLQTALPPGESSLEHRFEQIGRVADLVWWPHKIIFEVQCSSITALEVEQRNKDYASLGFQVVWVLNDRQYNKTRLSAAEHLLFSHPHFFTNIDLDGKGIIYDQMAEIRYGFRHKRSEIFKIDVAKPLKMISTENVADQSFLHLRLQSWPIYFAGDLIDTYLQTGFDVGFNIQKGEKKKLIRKATNAFRKAYQICLKQLIEHLCS